MQSQLSAHPTQRYRTGFKHNAHASQHHVRHHQQHQSCFQALALQYEVQAARNSAELRSVASLRAAIFFDPTSTNCSELAGQSFIRTKAASMWDYLEEVTAIQSKAGKGSTTCFYASIRDDPENTLVADITKEMDLSCKLPASEDVADPGAYTTPSIVIGSLDLTIGLRLGGETLAGKFPLGQAAARGRAYICNVSVAAAARRQGVAGALIEAAQKHASQERVSDLYIHAAFDNDTAIRLYQHRCGFSLEQTEALDVARSHNRPKRLLFRKQLLF